MNREKIDEIGQKLNVNSSVIKPRKSPNCFKKHSFWMIHVTNLILSSLMGLIFGLNLINDPYVHAGSYPYITDYRHKTLWSVLTINTVNGIITIPQKKKFNLERIAENLTFRFILTLIVRIGIVILNFIVSLTISVLIFNTFIPLLRPSPINVTEAIMYNVYKSPAVNYIQNKKIPMKNNNINNSEQKGYE